MYKRQVLDLYCGTGTITLAMAGAAKRVIGVEIIEQAIADAREQGRLGLVLTLSLIHI